MGWAPANHTSKFYLFTPEFKKWDNIIYLDSDIIVRASLDQLTKIRGFGAVLDAWNNKLSGQIISSTKRREIGLDKKIFSRLLKELRKDYNIKEPAFNTGVLAFSTDIIKKSTFPQLNHIFKKYRKISVGGDQLTFNLLFYKKWIELSQLYNIWPTFMRRVFNLEDKKIKGIILHFVGISKTIKPWTMSGYFNKEWKHNLERAELIDLKKFFPSIKEWNNLEIENYSLYLKSKHAHLKKIYIKTKENIEYILRFMPGYIIRNTVFFIGRNIGHVGTFLKKNFLKLYFIFKKIKK
ncbi:MAG: glycosyltransferase [Candidatus Hodarchaeota archaeon]